jgi:hypothetical protein
MLLSHLQSHFVIRVTWFVPKMFLIHLNVFMNCMSYASCTTRYGEIWRETWNFRGGEYSSRGLWVVTPCSKDGGSKAQHHETAKHEIYISVSR